MPPRHHDRPGHGGVHHVVPQRIQRKPKPEVRTPVRATGSGRIGGVLFVVDRAVRPNFAEQSRPDDVQSMVLGASTRRGVGRRGRRVGRGRRRRRGERYARDARRSERGSTFHRAAIHTDGRTQLRWVLGNEPNTPSDAQREREEDWRSHWNVGLATSVSGDPPRVRHQPGRRGHIEAHIR